MCICSLGTFKAYLKPCLGQMQTWKEPFFCIKLNELLMRCEVWCESYQNITILYNFCIIIDVLMYVGSFFQLYVGLFFISLINPKSYVLCKEPHMELSWPLHKHIPLCHNLTSPTNTFTWSSFTLQFSTLYFSIFLYNHAQFDDKNNRWIENSGVL